MFQIVGVNQHTEGAGQTQAGGDQTAEHHIRSAPESLVITHDDIITGRDLECDSECGSGGDTRHGGGGEAGGQLTNIRRGDLHHV